MIATDLDGTLLGSHGRVGARSLEALRRLGDEGVLRVVATGRSAFSARRVLPLDLPIDYLVVSSGAGIIDWSTGEYLRTWSLTAAQTAAAVAVLVEFGLDFMVHEPIPENHRFAFRRAGGWPDFERRVALYEGHCIPWSEAVPPLSCQLLAVHGPEQSPLAEIAARLPEFTVLRTTSPLDHTSVWIELFPHEVSKSQACAWIAARHGIVAADVVAVGNDTNDLDLLRWAGRGLVVGNAHPSLRSEFAAVAEHDADGFAEAAALCRPRLGP
jgi:hydroxymethylpyrimidine pyrophosphatase-like HAD family hydrolase